MLIVKSGVCITKGHSSRRTLSTTSLHGDIKVHGGSTHEIFSADQGLQLHPCIHFRTFDYTTFEISMIHFRTVMA